MRYSLPIYVSAVAAVLAAALVIAAVDTSAQAQNYPWCAHYGTPYDDTSCGFTSYEQCMASVSGIGGFCATNDTYKPPLGVRPQAHRHHSKNS
jgi:Protein of unknown function (DUF3551)